MVKLKFGLYFDMKVTYEGKDGSNFIKTAWTNIVLKKKTSDLYCIWNRIHIEE